MTNGTMPITADALFRAGMPIGAQNKRYSRNMAIVMRKLATILKARLPIRKGAVKEDKEM